jgi:hypothetical protein
MANTKITADVIEANAVLAVSIADENITSAKLADLAVTEGKIANSAITAGKIATDAVITAKIQNGAITSAKLDTNIAIAGTLTTTGEIVANGGIALGDNDIATFGASDDLQIYHDGSNSFIDNGTGSLTIDSGVHLFIKNASGESLANFLANGAAELYYDNAKKLATTTTGIDVTGTATMDGLTVDGAADIDYQSGATNNTAPDTLKVSNKTTGVHAAGLGASIKFEHTNSSASYSGSRISNVSNADYV